MKTPAETLTLNARWIVADVSNPVENGSLFLASSVMGKVKPKPADDGVDLGDVAILSGFVNAHTHLDLSSFDTPIPAEGGFSRWLARVVEHRRLNAADPSEAIDRGIAELIHSGTALVGDIGAVSTPSHTRIADSGVSGIMFPEIIGLHAERYEPLWDEAEKIRREPQTKDVAVSVSPHAPYSTAPEVYRRCRKMVTRLPLVTHWFESEEEIEFLKSGRGPMRDFLESIGAWDSSWQPSTDPWNDYLGSGRWTLIHTNYLTPGDIELMAKPMWRRRLKVVFCPRTHAHFGHPRHPFRELRKAGIDVGLGTDSRASNPDLSVFEEARWLAAHEPDVSPTDILDMLTGCGARAIGRRGFAGHMAPLEHAHLTVIRPGPIEGNDILSAIFDPRSEVVGLMVRGEWLKRPPGVPEKQ